MSQLAPIAFSSMPPVLPSNIAALAEQSFTDAFSGFRADFGGFVTPTTDSNCGVGGAPKIPLWSTPSSPSC